MFDNYKFLLNHKVDSRPTLVQPGVHIIGQTSTGTYPQHYTPVIKADHTYTDLTQIVNMCSNIYMFEFRGVEHRHHKSSFPMSRFSDFKTQSFDTITICKVQEAYNSSYTDLEHGDYFIMLGDFVRSKELDFSDYLNEIEELDENEIDLELESTSGLLVSVMLHFKPYDFELFLSALFSQYEGLSYCEDEGETFYNESLTTLIDVCYQEFQITRKRG
jgi:uncharacterized protein (DUF2344 family)